MPGMHNGFSLKVDLSFEQFCFPGCKKRPTHKGKDWLKREVTKTVYLQNNLVGNDGGVAMHLSNPLCFLPFSKRGIIL